MRSVQRSWNAAISPASVIAFSGACWTRSAGAVTRGMVPRRYRRGGRGAGGGPTGSPGGGGHPSRGGGGGAPRPAGGAAAPAGGGRGGTRPPAGRGGGPRG